MSYYWDEVEVEAAKLPDRMALKGAPTGLRARHLAIWLLALFYLHRVLGNLDLSSAPPRRAYAHTRTLTYEHTRIMSYDGAPNFIEGHLRLPDRASCAEELT